jgi:pimeloyl-ACP methyl ester carboxylesterase
MRNLVFIAALAIAGCTGCWTPPHRTLEQEQRGLVMMLPGIEGRPWQMAYLYRALRDEGVESAIVVRNWSRATGSLSNLIDRDANDALARDMACDIAGYWQRHPGNPIDLVGFSGGAGVIVLTVEALPAEVRVRNVILAQAALSPEYDLTKTLEHVDGRLINYHCPTDWAVLGLGTLMFGTIDRVHTASAGKDGFVVEKAVARESLRERLMQHAWTLDDFETGHWGGHLGIGTYGWNRKYVAAVIAGEK